MAEFWEFDSRLAKRWNVDPKPNINFSPYATFENNPILKFDPLGDSIITGNYSIHSQLDSVSSPKIRPFKIREITLT